MNRVAPALVMLALGLSGCASSPKESEKVEQARAELESIKTDPTVQATAPTLLLDAEQALDRAENAHEKGDKETRDHQRYLAERYMETAQAIAATSGVEAETLAMGEERNRLALAAREKELARQQEELAQARERSQELESELAALEAKRTDRGMLVTLDDVFFETAGASIASGASRSLSRVVEFLKGNPDQKIFVEGHTDAQGDGAYNQRLSEQRAEAVKKEIVAGGISPERVIARGYGENRPVASNARREGRQLNRRVEIIFPDNTP